MSLYTNLEAYWDLDETTGDRADSTGNGHTLSERNSPTYDTGIIGNSGKFSNTYSCFRNTSDGVITGTTYSISTWVKPLQIPNSGAWSIFFKFRSNGYDYLSAGYTNDKTIQLRRASGATRDTANNTVALNTWIHIVIVCNATTMTVYGDGTELGSWSNSPSDPGASGIWLCNEDVGVLQQMQIDETSIWSRELSSDEITRLYNGGNGWTYPLPVDYEVAAVAQTYALTGIDVFLQVSGQIFCEVANYALTWIQTQVSHDKYLSATTQSYLLTWIDNLISKTRWNQPNKNTTTFTKPTKH